MINPEFGSLGSLRRIMLEHEALPNSTMIMAQVVGQNRGAWNMHSQLGPVHGNSNMLVVTLSHPQLLRLPDWEEIEVAGIDEMNEVDYIAAVGKLAMEIKKLNFPPPEFLTNALKFLFEKNTNAAKLTFIDNNMVLTTAPEFRSILDWVFKYKADRYP